MNDPATIETGRLLLRRFELSDADEVQRLAGDRAIADTTLNIPHPYEDGMARAWINTLRPKSGQGGPTHFAIVLRATGALAGAIGLTVITEFERAELGYWIGKPYWNRGYCTEAGRAILRYGFTVLKLNRIHAAHFTRNPASGRIMQKIGMRHEGRAPQHARKWDRFEDMECYGVLRVHWMPGNGGKENLQ